MYDKLKVELVFFESKNSDGLKILKPANFMFVKTDDLHNYVMPVPTSMRLSTSAGKVNKSTWLEIVGIHIYDARQGYGIPTQNPVQYFGDV